MCTWFISSLHKSFESEVRSMFSYSAELHFKHWHHTIPSSLWERNCLSLAEVTAPWTFFTPSLLWLPCFLYAYFHFQLGFPGKGSYHFYTPKHTLMLYWQTSQKFALVHTFHIFISYLLNTTNINANSQKFCSHQTLIKSCHSDWNI